LALGEISTKSSSCSLASDFALEIEYTPISTLSPTKRTSSTNLMCSLILCGSSLIILQGFLPPDRLLIAITVSFKLN